MSHKNISVKANFVKLCFCVITCVFSVACSSESVHLKVNQQSFLDELTQLQEQFHIPGMTVLVMEGDLTLAEHYLGYGDIENKILMDADTTIPMASLTKMFTGILVMRAIERGKLSLEDPINEYVKNQNIPSEIQVKHVLSHTSQGDLGKHFYYSARFSWFTIVLQKIYGLPLEEIIKNEIITTLDLKNTYPLLNKDSHTKHKIAQPYFYEGKTKKGFIDYGFSASAGVTSTVKDLGVLSRAIDNYTLISEESWNLISNSFHNSLPYGYGFFSQQYHGSHLVWAYGQYDCYSSIFIKIPEKNLTFIIAANNNLLADPARLINGDITDSLFALSFLRHFVGVSDEFKRSKLLAQALAESFLAIYEEGKEEKSKAILRQIFNDNPDVEQYAELSLLHNLSMLKTIAEHRGQEDFTEFDDQLIKISEKLLHEDESNPYANIYYAGYFSQIGDMKNARKYYSKVVEANNFSSNWYTEEAKAWLKNNSL
ncbi:MAG: serine hydrolase domain-containing protein [Methylococcales bacterium]